MMNRREELNVEMMEQVNGGATLRYYHEGCGGNLWHCTNMFYNTRCSKCGDEHYFESAFENIVYTKDGKNYYWAFENGRDYIHSTSEYIPYSGDTSIYHYEQ